MSEQKIDFKEITDKATETAKNAWLVSLGATGKASEEAQEQFEKFSEKLNSESKKLFEELIATGKKVEEESTSKYNEMKEKSSATLEERFAQVKESLTFTSSKSDVSAQLEEVSKKLDTIISALGAKKTTAKKTTAKKSS